MKESEIQQILYLTKKLNKYTQITNRLSGNGDVSSISYILSVLSTDDFPHELVSPLISKIYNELTEFVESQINGIKEELALL